MKVELWRVLQEYKTLQKSFGGNSTKAKSNALRKEIKERMYDEWDKISPSDRRSVIELFADKNTIPELESRNLLSKLEPSDLRTLIEAADDQLDMDIAKLIEQVVNANPKLVRSISQIFNNFDSDFADLPGLLEDLLVCDNVSLNDVAFSMIMHNELKLGRYMMAEVTDRIGMILQKDDYKKIISLFNKYLTPSITSQETIGLTAMLGNPFLVDELIQRKFFNATAYKLTNDKRFLPDVLKNIFLVKKDK